MGLNWQPVLEAVAEAVPMVLPKFPGGCNPTNSLRAAQQVK